MPATVHMTMGGVMASGVPSYASAPEFAQTITSSASNQVSTIIATSRCRFCSITAMGNVWVSIGPTPVAAAGTGYLVAAGMCKDFSIAAGDKIAILDAA